jgi:type III secretion protein T
MFDAQHLWSAFAPLLMALPRVTTTITVAPLFPSTLFPRLLHSAIAVSLSLHLYPYMDASMLAASTPLLWVALAAKEAFLGALLGVAVGSLIWAFECVGALLDFQMGLTSSELFDPFGGHPAAPMGELMTRLGVILFLVAGGLQVLASLLFESFHLWPVASLYPQTGHLADLAGESVRSLTELTVRLAAPAMLLLALVDLGFGLVSRVVPQLNVFYFTMPIKGALAALMVALYLSYLAEAVTVHLSDLPHWLAHAASELAVR